jgi:hypothetical protein
MLHEAEPGSIRASLESLFRQLSKPILSPDDLEKVIRWQAHWLVISHSRLTRTEWEGKPMLAERREAVSQLEPLRKALRGLTTQTPNLTAIEALENIKLLVDDETRDFVAQQLGALSSALDKEVDEINPPKRAPRTTGATHIAELVRNVYTKITGKTQRTSEFQTLLTAVYKVLGFPPRTSVRSQMRKTG